MDWSQVERKIRADIIPGTTGVLKCDGIERRTVTSNAGAGIGMRTGVRTGQTKAIKYPMLRLAFESLDLRGRFDLDDFKSRFASEYSAAPCRYSMTGGVLIEIGLAKLVRSSRGEECHYLKNDKLTA